MQLAAPLSIPVAVAAAGHTIGVTLLLSPTVVITRSRIADSFAIIQKRQYMRWLILMNEFPDTAFAFVVAGSAWVQPDGQIMFILILTLAAAEACIGLAIVLQFYHRFHHLDVDAASEMRG